MREFSVTYFKNSNVIPSNMYDSLKDAKEFDKGEFDILSKILRIHRKDDFMNELMLKDVSGEVGYLDLQQMKFSML